jgi:hypothetical protein
MRPIAAWSAAALLGAASLAWAHHPPKFERCQSLTFEGQIERIDWRNPHVALSVRATDGTSYELLWQNVQQLTRAGIAKNTLAVGDRVAVAASRQARSSSAAALLHSLTRAADHWQWLQEPQGCS